MSNSHGMIQLPKTQKDLFGNKAATRRIDKAAAALRVHDKDTFANRLARYKLLESLAPHGYSALGAFEPLFVFEEARLCFLNGAFIATVVLCQAFIEHWLTGYASRGGDDQELPRTLDGMLKYCRREGLLHDYLIDRIDQLRAKRNPFTHRKDMDHPLLLWRRAMALQATPAELLEQDAKDAVSLAHTIMFSPHGFLFPLGETLP